jgi:hypothetical protein
MSFVCAWRKGLFCFLSMVIVFQWSSAWILWRTVLWLPRGWCYRIEVCEMFDGFKKLCVDCMVCLRMQSLTGIYRGWIMHVVRVWWIGKDVEGSGRRSRPRLGLYREILQQQLSKTTTRLIHESPYRLKRDISGICHAPFGAWVIVRTSWTPSLFRVYVNSIWCQIAVVYVQHVCIIFWSIPWNYGKV